MKRKLSAGERMFWLESQVFPVNGAAVARIKNPFSLEQLRAALSKLKIRNPLLTVRVIVENEREASFTSEGVAEVPIRLVERLGDDDWVREVEKELISFFDFEKGPLVRVVWLKSEQMSELIVTTNHCVTDGMADSSLIRNILYLLAEPERELEPLPELSMFSELIPSFLTSDQEFLQQAEQLAVAFEEGESLQQYEDIGVSNKLDKIPRFSVLAWELSQKQTSIMNSRCRAEQTTAHCAICVAFLQAYAEVVANSKTSTRKMSSPVDLRHYLSRDIGENWGVFISLISASVVCAPEQAFWEIARDLMLKLMGELTEENLFMFPLAMELATESKSHDELLKAWHYPDTEDDMIISNLGNLKLPEQYGSLSLEGLYVIGSALECPLLMIATFGGRTFFTLTYSDFIMNSTTAEQLKEKAMQDLAQAVGW